jgi:hypothetical protein
VRKISCRLNINELNNVEGEQSSFAKATFGGAEGTEQRTFTLDFRLNT